MLRPLFVLLFRLSGWKIRGKMPDVNKYICAVAPHTSNWDFIVGVAARSILRMQHARYLGKSQLFKAPYGWFFRWIGGIPVYRDKSHDMVQQVAAIAKESDRFILAIAPEGTRKKVGKLKTGFWYIAHAASMPVVPVGFDYSKKEVVIGDPLFTHEVDADLESLLTFYRTIRGKNPEQGL